jgi:membrane protein
VPTRAQRRRELKRLVDLWVGLFREHELLTYASAIAMQAFVAAVALVLFGLGMLGATGHEDVWNSSIAPQIQSRVLPGVFAGIDETVQTIFQQNSAGLLVFASLLAVWEVSGGVRAIMGALNRIYETEETRSWMIRRPLSLGIAIVIIAALSGALLVGIGLRHTVHGSWGLPFAVLRWVAAIVLLGLAFGLLVRLAPAERRATSWATGGATLVVVAWLVQSLIFRWYVTSVANFKTAPGSLLAFLVITTYFYVGAIILLVGIELDELLRKDVQGEDRAIHEIVRGLL